MHQPPNVPNHGKAGKGARLVEGMALAVEPMVVVGEPWTHTDDDRWTVRTDDGSLAAHFEHTFTLTQRGTWVLTALDGGEARLAASASRSAAPDPAPGSAGSDARSPPD